MSRRIVAYVDGKAVWEDLGPAEHVGWGHTLGGQAIQERGPMTKQEIQLRHRAVKRLRGSLLEPGQKA